MRIAIDAGHGIFTSGKRCDIRIDPNETSEWFLNQRIATKICDKLSEYEAVDTLRLDDVTGKEDVPLIRRTNKANGWMADWVISCHHNAGIKGGKGGGIVVFTYTTPSSAEISMQKAIYNSCMAHGGLSGRSEPINRANFHMVREPKCNAVLIEYGFMDSTTDTPIILTEDFAERMATATTEAIANELKLKRKEENESMTEAEKKRFAELEAKVKELEASKEKVYHYWNELPEYAVKPLKALSDKGIYSHTPDDLNISKTKMECLVNLARAMKEMGHLKY